MAAANLTRSPCGLPAVLAVGLLQYDYWSSTTPGLWPRVCGLAALARRDTWHADHGVGPAQHRSAKLSTATVPKNSSWDGRKVGRELACRACPNEES